MDEIITFISIVQSDGYTLQHGKWLKKTTSSSSHCQCHYCSQVSFTFTVGSHIGDETVSISSDHGVIPGRVVHTVS